jgi:hypothetical protein
MALKISGRVASKMASVVVTVKLSAAEAADC